VTPPKKLSIQPQKHQSPPENKVKRKLTLGKNKPRIPSTPLPPNQPHYVLPLTRPWTKPQPPLLKLANPLWQKQMSGKTPQLKQLTVPKQPLPPPAN
jgi:hypothetical protein